MKVRTILFAAALAATTFAVPGAMRAEEPEWPSEAEERLEHVEAKLLDVQLKLAVARLNGKQDEAQQLGKKFDELEKEQLRLLRATGKIDF